MALALGFRALQFLALVAVQGLLGLACLILDLAGFDEAALLLVVFPRRGAVALAFIGLLGLRRVGLLADCHVFALHCH